MNNVDRARRELDNMRGYVRRTGLTGWVQDRRADGHYRSAFAAVVAVEDELGVEHPTSIKLSDRLLALRYEAQEAGLLNASEILAAESKVLS